MRNLRPAGVALVVLAAGACAKPASVDEEWVTAIAKFRKDRASSIGGPEGWVALVGRFTLVAGANTVGAVDGAQAQLPADRSPPNLGTIELAAGKARWTTTPGADVKVGGAPVTALELADDSKGEPTVLEAGSLRLHVIRRGDDFILRVRDLAHPALAGFTGLDWFPLEPSWRVRAKLEPSPPGTTVDIVNVLDQIGPQPSPGHLVFEHGGQNYRLVALQDGDDGLFVLFKDQTAGKGTYPAGRFINTSPRAADGTVELDFNRAYSPPCAFTAFATCPLPPEENYLALAVEAGEKYSASH